jgi:L-asparaginase/glutamin-(asparagin-)ase
MKRLRHCSRPGKEPVMLRIFHPRAVNAIGAMLLAALLATPPDVRAGALPRIALLATGGTIAGSGADSTVTVGYKPATVGVDALVAAVPELKTVANVHGEQVFQIASENMTPAQWLQLSERVNALLAADDMAGVVITHGTDTIEETAYFLNLTVRSRKPVVVVGAMRPSTAMSADGPLNLYNAVSLAASPEAAGKGVLVMLNDQISAARDVSKTHTSAVDSFRTPELGVLGYMQRGKPRFYRQTVRRHTMDSEFDVRGLKRLPKVDIVYSYAGVDRGGLDAMVGNGAEGIVHAGTGNGSTAAQMKSALREARGKGVLVVRSSRTGQGAVARNGEVDDDVEDFVASDTLNPQKARILLMLALTKTRDTDAIQEMFETY